MLPTGTTLPAIEIDYLRNDSFGLSARELRYQSAQEDVLPASLAGSKHDLGTRTVEMDFVVGRSTVTP